MLDYLKNRLSERSTAAGLAGLAVSGAMLIFPQYATIISMVAGALGVGVAVLPTGGSR